MQRLDSVEKTRDDKEKSIHIERTFIFFNGVLDRELISSLSNSEIKHLKRTYVSAQKYLNENK
jgi:hypothetical protein